MAAPVSTFDFSMQSGADIPIEEKNAAEVANFSGISTAPEGKPYHESIVALQQKIIKGVL